MKKMKIVTKQEAMDILSNACTTIRIALNQLDSFDWAELGIYDIMDTAMTKLEATEKAVLKVQNKINPLKENES